MESEKTSVQPAEQDAPSHPGATRMRLVDRDAARGRELRRIIASCGAIARVLRRAEQLEDLPDKLSIVLIHDGEDEQSDQFVEACVARGHGAILYSGAPRLARVTELLVRGAVGYLAWPFEPAEFRQALEVAERLGRRRIGVLARQAQADALCKALSPRELEVLALCTDGRTSKDIGQALSISGRTVEHHRANMRKKLGSDGTFAVRLGVYAGLDPNR